MSLRKGMWRGTVIAGVAAALLPAFLFASPVLGAEPLLQKGREIAQANCAKCHNITHAGDSPFRPAPPFRVIARMYKASDIEEALVEGIVVGHPAMPEFTMSGEDAVALSAFIDSLGR